MKFSGKVGNGPVNKWLNFDGEPDPRIAKLVRRGLAEVYTEPVLLVIIVVVRPHCSTTYIRRCSLLLETTSTQ